MAALKIYGSVIVRGVTYDCDEIAQIVNLPLPLNYGTDWVFGGDLDLEECDIIVNDKCFVGVTALTDALAAILTHKA